MNRETFPIEWQGYQVIAKPVDEAGLRSALQSFIGSVCRCGEADAPRA
jgi:hypothetical protein